MSSIFLNVSGNALYLPNTKSNKSLDFYDLKLYDVVNELDISNMSLHLDVSYSSVIDNQTIINFEIFFKNKTAVNTVYIGSTAFDVHLNKTNIGLNINPLSYIYSQKFTIICKSNIYIVLSKLFVWGKPKP